jgi:hypothetical protein
MSIRAIEDSIIKRLKADFKDLFVDGFPEKPQEFSLIHPIGALLVHYRGGNYSDSNALGYIIQSKKMNFAITVVTRNLRSNEGTYEILDKVKKSLCGFKIDECTRLTTVKEDFISETNGIWQYEIIFSLTTPSVEDIEEREV